MTRRFPRIAALALCAAIASSAAACTRPVTTAPGAHNPWTIPGVLRLGEDEEPDGLNPMFAHTAATDAIDGMIFSFVLRYDQYGNYVPDLATAVPTLRNGGISPDGRTIVVHLRKDARWADGVPLTSADWMFTYRAVNDTRNNVKTRFGWDAIETANAPDPYTIVLKLKRPSPVVLGILAWGGSAYPPLPAHVLAHLSDLNSAPFNEKPLSSGPYVLQRWNHGSSLDFVPNPRYFRGAPKLRRVIWKIVPDVNTLFNQLRTHDVDVYPSVNENAVPQLTGIAGVDVVKLLTANWRHLGINISRPALSDVRVRQAIAQAVDWKRINDTVYHGLGVLAVSDVYPKSWAAPDLPPYRYDLAGAKRLLAGAGWTPGPDGIVHKGSLAMRLTISATTGHQENEQSEVLIQSMLRDAGIGVEIRNYPGNFLFSQTGPLYSGKYDLEWSIETNGPDPDNSGSWNSAFIPPNGANTSWLRDPQIDSLSTAAASTFDQTKRKALYQREEARLRELVPAVFFTWRNGYTAINTDVKNYVPAAFIGDTWNCWQWTI